MQYLLAAARIVSDTFSSAPLVESHSVEAVVVGLIVGAGKVWDLLKGRRHNRANSDSLHRIEHSLNEARLEVRDLRAHVIGPDGTNGLRGDVRDLRDEVKGILERERDRLSIHEIGAFRPPR